jgi:3-oxoacyl-[acyl-carrier-protein] synthase II
MNPSRRRVVITGVSVISPLGNTQTELWDALASGRSGVGPLTAFPPHALPISFAAEARDFRGNIEDFGPLDKEQKKAIRKGLKVMCRECQMGVAAAQRALADAGWGFGRLDPQRSGIVFGSDYMLTLPEEFTEGIRSCLDDQGHFDFSRWPLDGMAKMSPLWLLKYLPNMPASHIAIYNDLRGPNNSVTVREAAANVAIAEGYWKIAEGRADAMLVGATGTRIHPMKTVHALQQEELAPGNGDPAKASRPFDRHRTGMVLGEGAGALILEELDAANARGATLYGELIGSATSSVVGRNLIARRGEAMLNVLTAALRCADASPEDVGHLHAHGLSTRSGDAEEAWAIGQAFQGRGRPLPVTAAKSYFGNLGAGSGMVEVVASLMALKHNQLFPILNYETPDPGCPIHAVRDGLPEPGHSFINLNVTPQGQASAVMIRRAG